MHRFFMAVRKRKRPIVVGMSGGVDSSMSLLLLKHQGWDPIGVSLKYCVWQNPLNKIRENVCCSAESFRIAEEVCRRLGVPHHIVDVSQEFKSKVIDYFLSELREKRTPNPCIVCNRCVKFKKLIDFADKHGIEHVATGHYAKSEQDAKTKKFELRVARDVSKDQTYSLCFMPQEWLSRTIFPLGGFLKSEVYDMARAEGFELFLKRRESQDFCFVSKGAFYEFLHQEIGEEPGVIKDVDGRILGKHNGLHFYTIGQRKGIGLPRGPYFVVGYNVHDNVLIVSKKEYDLESKEAALSPCNFISGELLGKEIKVKAKVRYAQEPVDVVLSPPRMESEGIRVIFLKPQRAVTPGQYCVFYDGEVCLGGGRIFIV